MRQRFENEKQDKIAQLMQEMEERQKQSEELKKQIDLNNENMISSV